MSVIFFGLLANFVSHQEVIPIMFHERLLFYRERGLLPLPLPLPYYRIIELSNYRIII